MPITNPDSVAGIQNFYEAYAIGADSFARSVALAYEPARRNGMPRRGAGSMKATMASVTSSSRYSSKSSTDSRCRRIEW